MSKADTTKSSIAAIVGLEPKRLGRRGDDRTKTVGRLVRVEHEQDEGLARCHNISDGGMAINAVIPLNLNDHVTVTISLVELRGRVVWMNGRDCGIAFDQPIDSAGVLQNAAAARAVETARSPRPLTSLDSRVPYQGGTCPAVANAISVRGMKVTNDNNFRPGLKVRVILDDGFEQDGIVHWSQDNIAGVMLLAPSDVIELDSSRWISGSA